MEIIKAVHNTEIREFVRYNGTNIDEISSIFHSYYEDNGQFRVTDGTPKVCEDGSLVYYSSILVGGGDGIPWNMKLEVKVLVGDYVPVVYPHYGIMKKSQFLDSMFVVDEYEHLQMRDKL